METCASRQNASFVGGEGGGRLRSSQLLQHGLKLLELAVCRSTTLPQLISSAGIPQVTARRILQVLITRELLTMDPSGFLRAGSRLLLLTQRAQSQADLLAIACPLLEALSASTGCSAFLGRRDGDHCVHMHQSTGRERVAMTAPGTRSLLADTCLGRALLLDDEESAVERAFLQAKVDNVPAGALRDVLTSAKRAVLKSHRPASDFSIGFSSPIRDASGSIVAAISLVSTASSLTADRINALTEIVGGAAADISCRLGYF